MARVTLKSHVIRLAVIALIIGLSRVLEQQTGMMWGYVVSFATYVVWSYYHVIQNRRSERQIKQNLERYKKESSDKLAAEMEKAKKDFNQFVDNIDYEKLKQTLRKSK